MSTVLRAVGHLPPLLGSQPGSGNIGCSCCWLWPTNKGLGVLSPPLYKHPELSIAQHPVPPPCRYVRPGGGFVPNFQLFQKGDVNGAKEQKIFTFLKVSATARGDEWDTLSLFFGGARQ